ncbi:MAG: CDP-diacylglycerol--glycerol-3-phosphate 3-phosphatidyltransferase [Longimicrobiales bacterium]
MPAARLNLPNAITVARILVCPLISYLALSGSVPARYWAFVLFVFAALSDLWDGYLARKHGLITDVGKLLDPIADKLLLVSTFIPFYFIAQRPDDLDRVPWWGTFPLWVVLVVLGRELLVTLFRSYAARRGVVISAGQSGKYKAFIQNLFIGGLLLWYPLVRDGVRLGWSGSAWAGWRFFHEAWIGILLAVAVILTVYSMVDYLWSYRAVVRRGQSPQ